MFPAILLVLLVVLRTTLVVGTAVTWLILAQIGLFLIAMLLPVKDFFGSRKPMEGQRGVGGVG
jgi:hypothetical protein